MLLVVAVGIGVGVLLILLIARYGPPVEQFARMSSAPQITPAEFEDLITDLVRALGLGVVFISRGTGSVIDATLRDAKPLAGGRLLLHASPVLDHGKIEASEVLGFADSVRSDTGTIKGVFIALAGFTDEARSAARGSPAPLDLLDGPALLEIVRDVLPDRVALLRGYRGFVPA
ncbi:MAG: restriction endonuclease [Deltaproteobacteria bacterium]|nr:restriction endonuclease [Deltaproteobacteria bacterium]